MRRALVAGSILVVSSVAVGQTQESAARTRFNKGRDLFIAKQYDPALVEFRAAAELYESPNTRLYIGRCERELGHGAAAVVDLQRAASEAADRASSDPRYASTQNAAKQEASELDVKLAHITITAPDLPDGATVTINGAPLATAALGVPAPVDPGNIEVVAEAPGFVRFHKRLSASPGDAVEAKIQLAKAGAAAAAPAKSGGDDATSTDAETDAQPATTSGGHGLRNAGFVIGGIGLAGMGVFITFAVLAQNRFNDLQNTCNGPCNATYQSQIDEGQTFQNVANVMLAVGGTALVTGVVMLIVAAVSGKPAAQAAPASDAWVSPLPGGGWAAGIGHSF